jgi:hypothetical protein
LRGKARDQGQLRRVEDVRSNSAFARLRWEPFEVQLRIGTWCSVIAAKICPRETAVAVLHFVLLGSVHGVADEHSEALYCFSERSCSKHWQTALAYRLEGSDSVLLRSNIVHCDTTGRLRCKLVVEQEPGKSSSAHTRPTTSTVLTC